MSFPVAPERREAWEATGPLQLKMIEKHGACQHDDGAVFTFATPYDVPAELCPALAAMAREYVWRVAMGFPSWEEGEPDVYRLHCPSRTGTVWELRKLTRR